MQQNKEQQLQQQQNKKPQQPQPQPQVQPQPSETSKIDLKTPSFIPVENVEAEQQQPPTSTASASTSAYNHDEAPVFAASHNIEPDSLDPDINNENNGLGVEDAVEAAFLTLDAGMCNFL